jgi:L-aminopeptidase/D-esterase-like protein
MNHRLTDLGIHSPTIHPNPSTRPSTVAQQNFVEAKQFRKILSAAADTYSRAITHAVLKANPELGETYCVRFPGACEVIGNKNSLRPASK